MQFYFNINKTKTILQGTVKGGRRQGRQRKRWEDNTREWTGLEFGKSQKAVENREKWRLQNHPWCPNDRRGQGINDDDDDDNWFTVQFSEQGQRWACLVKKEWTTKETFNLGEGTNFSLRGFQGDYEVLVNRSGVTVQREVFTLGKKAQTVTLNVTASKSEYLQPVMRVGMTSQSTCK